MPDGINVQNTNGEQGSRGKRKHDMELSVDFILTKASHGRFKVQVNESIYVATVTVHVQDQILSQVQLLERYINKLGHVSIVLAENQMLLVLISVSETQNV